MYKVSLKAGDQEFEYQCAPSQTPLRAARDQIHSLSDWMSARET